jgi:hypothetical protein
MNSRSLITDETLDVKERLVRQHLNLTARGDIGAVEANVTSDQRSHRQTLLRASPL